MAVPVGRQCLRYLTIEGSPQAYAFSYAWKKTLLDKPAVPPEARLPFALWE
jgi:hypothetical protein